PPPPPKGPPLPPAGEAALLLRLLGLAVRRRAPARGQVGDQPLPHLALEARLLGAQAKIHGRTVLREDHLARQARGSKSLHDLPPPSMLPPPPLPPPPH